MLEVSVKNGDVVVKKASRKTLCEAVYMLAMLIPPGKTTSYSSIGRILGIHARKVAKCLSENAMPIIVPCHRVVYSNLSIGGYSRGGRVVKEKLLRLEGVILSDGKISRSSYLDLGDLIANAHSPMP